MKAPKAIGQEASLCFGNTQDLPVCAVFLFVFVFARLSNSNYKIAVLKGGSFCGRSEVKTPFVWLISQQFFLYALSHLTFQKLCWSEKPNANKFKSSILRICKKLEKRKTSEMFWISTRMIKQKDKQKSLHKT